MPTLQIEGRRVQVDDSFLKLSPEDQNKQVDEIASHIRSMGSNDKAPEEPKNTGILAAVANSAARGVAGIIQGAQGVVDATPGLSDVYKQAENSVPDALKRYTPRNIARRLSSAVNYQRPEDATLQNVKDKFNQGDYLGTAEGVLKGSLYTAAEAAPYVAAASQNPLAATGVATSLFGQNLEQRQENNGGRTPDLKDIAASAGGALVQTALDAFGGSLASKGLVKGAAGGLGIAAGGNAAQRVATQAGTDKGLNTDDVKDALEEGAIFGPGSGMINHVASASAKAAVGKITGDTKAARAFKENPDQVLSDARVAAMADAELSNAANVEGLTGPDAESKAVKNVRDRLLKQIKGTTDVLEAAGVIDKDLHHRLIDPEASETSLASRHNRFVTEYGLDRLRAAFPDPQIADAYVQAIRDLDTASNSSLYKARSGLISRLGGYVGSALGGLIGLHTGGGYGMSAGMIVGSQGGRAVGYGIERLLGAGRPPVISRANSRARYLAKQGIDPGVAGDALSAVEVAARKYIGDLTGIDLPDASAVKLAMANKLKAQREQDAATAKQLRLQQKQVELQQEQLRKENEKLNDKTFNQLVTQQGGPVQPGATPDPMSMPRQQSTPLPVMDPSVTPGQLNAANKGVMKLMADLEKQKQALEAQAQEAEKRVAENDAVRQKYGGSLDELLVRTDGWLQASVTSAQERYRHIPLQLEDFTNALNEVVSQGRISKEAAEVALKVPGARLGKRGDDSLYYEVQDRAIANAAKRQGIEWTADNAIKERYRSKEAADVEKAQKQGRLSVVRKESASAERKRVAAIKKAEKEAERKAKGLPPAKPRSASKKAPDTQTKQTSDSVDDQVEIGRRKMAIQSEITANDKAVARAVDKAPTPEFADLAQQMRDTPGYDAKQALYRTAKEAAKTKVQLEWVGKHLHPLTMFGEGGGQIRRAFMTAHGSLFDPTIVTKVKVTK